jgi:hypothetical protein
LKYYISHTFLQKKKGKKRKPSCLVEGFKKESFSDKILPYASVETLCGCCGFENVWVEILSGTEGLNLLF